MPNQTTKTTYVYFPDGSMVSVKASGDSSYFDVGAIQSAITATLNWTENEVETANAGTLAKQIRAMKIAGGFTLINLDPDGVVKMGGGIFTSATTTDSPTSNIDDQTIDADWSDKILINLEFVDSTSGDSYKPSTTPTITSVTASLVGALAADDDYFIITDTNSPSGYSIMFNTAGSASVTTAESIVVDFNSVTPIASTIIYAGQSTKTLTAYAMKITHTDDNNKVRELELFSVDPNSGGFQFNYKGANEDGVEEMPLTFTGKLDTSRTNGRQLMSWTVEDGAA